MADRLAMTAAEVEMPVPGVERIVFADTFALDRDPAHVLELLDEAEIR
jgi:hypothetical protein